VGLYHNPNRPNKVKEMVSFSPKFQALFDQASGDGQRGCSYGAPAILSWLVGVGIARIRPTSMPQPPSGYKLQNKIRRRRQITPMSVEAFKAHATLAPRWNCADRHRPASVANPSQSKV
jgi:hypothetical protein